MKTMKIGNTITIMAFITIALISGCIDPKDDIKYPEDMSEIRGIVSGSHEVNIIWDDQINKSAYPKSFDAIMVELYCAVGAVHGSEGSPQYIYSYIKEGDECYLASTYTFKNVTNHVTVPAKKELQNCDINRAIYVIISDKNEVRIEGDRVYIFGNAGDDKHLSEAVIKVRRAIDNSTECASFIE